MKRLTTSLLVGLCTILVACGDPAGTVQGEVVLTVDSAAVRYRSDRVGASVKFGITNVGEGSVEFHPCAVNFMEREIGGEWRAVGSFPMCNLEAPLPTVEIASDSTYRATALILCEPETLCENWIAPFAGSYRLVLTIAPLPRSATRTAPFDVDVVVVP